MSNTILPTHSRASRFSYDFRRLRDIPTRIFCPCDAGVGTVRSFKLTPKYDVKLEDVLEARHLPPLGLKDFEEYLLFVEHSAENLYFWMWFAKYEEMYRTLGQGGAEDLGEYSDKDIDTRHQLRESYARARATFFERGAPMELNLPALALKAIPSPPLPSASHEWPVHPRELAAAKAHVTPMLKASLSDFVKSHSANSGRLRGLFALFAGLVFCAVGLAPILLSFRPGYGRFLALAALPCVWLGVTTIIAGLHGVCVVIFLFGDARQLHPFELVAPSEEELLAARQDRKQAKVVLPQEASPDTSQDNVRELKKQESFDEKGGCRTSGDSEPTNAARTSRKSCKLGLAADLVDSSQITPFLAYPWSNSNSSASTLFEWEISSSKASIKERRFKAGSIRSVFAPMTEVLSPVVRRSQWTIVMRSAVVGFVVAWIVCGLCTLRV